MKVASVRVKDAVSDVTARSVEQVSPVKVLKQVHDVVPLEVSSHRRVPAKSRKYP